MSLAFALRVRDIAWPGKPDPARVFVTLVAGGAVHEVDPRGPGVWGGIGSWSKRTLCRRRLHEAGRSVAQLADRGLGFTGASCNGCRAAAGPIVILHALIRWGEAMARRAPRVIASAL